MSRSNKKGAFADTHLMKKVNAAKAEGKHKPIKT
jgi:ribosomal protein S19